MLKRKCGSGISFCLPQAYEAYVLLEMHCPGRGPAHPSLQRMHHHHEWWSEGPCMKTDTRLLSAPLLPPASSRLDSMPNGGSSTAANGGIA
eukprot:357708-Chlamydomonas_euryale.AAC.3